MKYANASNFNVIDSGDGNVWFYPFPSGLFHFDFHMIIPLSINFHQEYFTFHIETSKQ